LNWSRNQLCLSVPLRIHRKQGDELQNIRRSFPFSLSKRSVAQLQRFYSNYYRSSLRKGFNVTDGIKKVMIKSHPGSRIANPLLTYRFDENMMIRTFQSLLVESSFNDE
jgi:hypothetical protein